MWVAVGMGNFGRTWRLIGPVRSTPEEEQEEVHLDVATDYIDLPCSSFIYRGTWSPLVLRRLQNLFSLWRHHDSDYVISAPNHISSGDGAVVVAYGQRAASYYGFQEEQT